jgi:hypothetical protein
MGAGLRRGCTMMQGPPDEDYELLFQLSDVRVCAAGYAIASRFLAAARQAEARGDIEAAWFNIESAANALRHPPTR